ncbi:MAG: acyl carrier protein [Defluviitaleaceae bacterium]|nr:acyl carrier protein [Defluviitaleaceae bacterium]
MIAKNNHIKEKLAELISNVLEKEANQDFYNQMDDFSRVNISSIEFIRLVVMIENEYDFEFMDEDLDQSKFQNISDLSEYIQRMKS